MLAPLLSSVLVVVAAPAGTPSQASSPSPTPVTQGEHDGQLVPGEPSVFAIDLAGGQARTQIVPALPAEARGVTLTLTFSVADHPEVVCTRNEAVLDADSEERPVLDSRRTDTPDPDDPCTQPGRHLLTAELADPDGTIGDAPVGFTLLLSVFGDEPDPSPSPSPAASRDVPSPPATSEPQAADRAATAGSADTRSLSQAVLATLLTVAALGGLATVLRRRRGTDG